MTTDIREAERLRRLAILVKFERGIEAETRRQYAVLLAAIADDILKDKAILAAIRDPNRGRNQANALWNKLLGSVLGRIGALFTQRFKGTGAPKVRLAKAQETFLTGMASRLSSVPGEVYADLDRIVADGVRSGLTEIQIQDQLRAELTPGHAEYEARLDSVASRVARTTAIAAFNAGDQQGFIAISEHDGVPMATKSWLSSHDTKVRATHVEADADPSNHDIPADADFTVGGFSAPYPGAANLPAHEAVNCRCTAIYRENGSLVASIVTRGDAVTTPETIIAAVSGLPNGFRGPIAALDVPTGDKRRLCTPDGGIKTREYPLSLTMNHVGDPTGYPVIGHLDRVWNGGDGLLYGEGPFDLNGQAGMEAARQLHEGHMNTVSIDPDMVVAAVNTYDAEGALVSSDQLSTEEAEYFRLAKGVFEIGQLRAFRGLAVEDVSPEAVEVSYELAFTDWRMAGLAMVPIPAYSQARIQPVYDYAPSQPGDLDAIVSASGKKALSKADHDYLHAKIAHHHHAIAMAHGYLANPNAQDQETRDIANGVDSDQQADIAEAQGALGGAAPSGGAGMALVAAAGGQVFNAAFFGDPKFTEYTPPTVDEDGHFYGHVREHGTCYQYGNGAGDGGFCLEPPDSACGYAKFEQHAAKLNDGRTIRVGAITFGDGHYSQGSLKASVAHYNDVATIAAKVNAGTDEFGIWVNGQVLDEYEHKAYDLLLSPLSGHWEPDADNRGHLEMIAAHIVVTPGYRARRIVAGFDDAGQPNSLIITTYPTPRTQEAVTVVNAPRPRAALIAAMNDLKRADELNVRILAGTERSIVAAAGSAHIASTSTPWNGPSAAASVLSHATKDGKIDVGVASQGFLAHVNDGSKRGDWKLPFARVSGGVFEIVPRGVAAAAGRLDQTEGVDRAAIGSKICGLYAKIRKADPTWPECPVGK